MGKKDELNKINKELKVYMNESKFISNKCRNKVIKMLGEELSIKLPIENYESIDISLTEEGNIIMRGEEYKRVDNITFEEVIERYNNFKVRADELLKKNEINYYTMHDKSNVVNIMILLVMLSVLITLVIFAFKSFLNGNYINCIWLLIFITSWWIPGLKDRIYQAINFIKRKLKK